LLAGGAEKELNRIHAHNGSSRPDAFRHRHRHQSCAAANVGATPTVTRAGALQQRHGRLVINLVEHTQPLRGDSVGAE
jgi:hypothetical protein